MKEYKTFDSLRYSTDVRGYYDVEVFGENGKKIDERKDIVDFTRRGAYFEVANELKPHKTWDATRTANYKPD